MKATNYLKGVICLITLTLITTLHAVDYPENSPVAINGKLSVDKTNLVNECMKNVQLRGMSSHGVAWFKNCYNEESISTLTNDWGIDLFRIALYVSETNGYATGTQSKESWHEWIDDMVDICEKNGIYCIIDWHILNESARGYDGDPMVHLEEAKYFWAYMSEKHADKKNVLYEICNEPNGSSVNWNRVKQYADTIIPIIRANDPNTVIIVGTPNWSQDVDIASTDMLDYDNIMYALHFYSGTHTDWLRSKANTAIRNGAALFVSEFGTSQASGSGGVYEEETDVWMNWMKANNISWANWSFADKDETSAALADGACSSMDWNNVSASGSYIKSKILEADEFNACGNDVDDIVSYDDNIYLFPNPTEDIFSIQIPDNAKINEVQIFELAGKCIYKNVYSSSINISNLPCGTYFVKILLEDGISVKRIYKK